MLGAWRRAPALAETGRTHRGKISLGRPVAADAMQVTAWRERNKASIADTAAHFKLSLATVKRYCADRQGTDGAGGMIARFCAWPRPGELVANALV